MNSALHRAVDNGNQRSINYILETMSHIDENSTANYITILSDLLDYEELHNFLQQLPCQTHVMMEKQIFRCDEPVNDRIIKQISKGAVFFTEDFYSKEMEEKPKENSHPVMLSALRVDWLINSDEGRDFLQNILLTGNLDFFNIDTIQYVVEFLFQKFKLVILFLLLPIFGFSHISYFILQRYNDSYNEFLFEKYGDDIDPDATIDLATVPSEEKQKVLLIAAICFVSWLIQAIQVIIFIYYGGLSYFKKFYSQLDILYLTAIATTFYFMSQLQWGEELKFSEYERLVKTTR